MYSEHDTEMIQGSIQRIDRTTRLICRVGDMSRFPRYNEQEEESETQGDSWTKVYTKTWISENKECYVQGWHTAITENKRKLLPYLPC